MCVCVCVEKKARNLLFLFNVHAFAHQRSEGSILLLLSEEDERIHNPTKEVVKNVYQENTTGMNRTT